MSCEFLNNADFYFGSFTQVRQSSIDRLKRLVTLMPLAFQHSVTLLDIDRTPQNLKLTLGILPSCCEEEILDLMDLFGLFNTSEQKIMRSILK